MKRQRRIADPLAPLLPVARVAAVGLVAAGACLVAVHVVPTTASTSRGAASAPPDTAAAKLVVIPQFAEDGTDQAAVSTTVTDRAEIARVAEIINALPLAPTGVFNCPMDVGGGLELDFEAADSAVVEQVSMHATGCGGTSIVISGEQQPRRASSFITIQQIASVLGTHWQLVPPLVG